MTPNVTSFVGIVLALALLLAPVTVHCDHCGTAFWEMAGAHCAVAHGQSNSVDSASEPASEPPAACPHCNAKRAQEARDGEPGVQAPDKCGCDKLVGIGDRAVESARVSVPEDSRLVEVAAAMQHAAPAGSTNPLATIAEYGGGGAVPLSCVTCVWRN